MLNFLGEKYYLDIDELESQVSLTKSKIIVSSGETENEQLSITRYETFKSLIDVVLTEREELDEGLGIHGANNLTFKISFNTLLLHKIIKKL